MIAHLTGQLLEKAPQHVVIDVGGVGYRVMIPVSTFYQLAELGSTVRVRVHTHVREDALQLFGFGTEREQQLFEKLIAVAGVGPKLALSILSGIEAPDLIQALRSNDLARLNRIPGVGRKTAERLVLELKDKFPDAPGPDSPPRSKASSAKEDLLTALLHLGYSRSEAERGIDRALSEAPAADADESAAASEARFQDLLRRTLHCLSGGRR